jgi:hypothetical protein
MGVFSHQPIRSQCLQGFREGPTHQIGISKASGSQKRVGELPRPICAERDPASLLKLPQPARIDNVKAGTCMMSSSRFWSRAKCLRVILFPAVLPGSTLALWPAELIRGPYLQMGTPTSVIVKWRTDEPTDSFVFYGPSPDNLYLVDGDFTPATEHSIRVTGLYPNTQYFYSIGSLIERLAGGDENHFFITHPPPGTAKPTRIWAIGDAGTASADDFGSHLVRDAYYGYTATNRTDVWLMLGDNAYYYGRDWEYQMAVFDTYPTILRNTILWSTLGNHETYGPDTQGRIAYHDIFSLPTEAEAGGVRSGTENYYSFDYANIHFVCLDSEISSRTRAGAMWNWLEQDLQANTNEWLIAFWHSPPYSKGSHDSDNLGDNFGNMTDMRTNFVSLLESYGVDLVLSGHSHNYERSFLLNGHYGFSRSLEPSMIKDSGSGRMDDTGPYIKAASDAGAIYIVAGSSGWATFRTGFHPVMYIQEVERGSLVLDVNGGRLDAKFLRETGAIDDYFTILKYQPEESFRISSFEINGGQITLRWNSAANRTYRIQSTPTLESPAWDWLNDPIPATEFTTSWQGTLPPGAKQQFYRVVEINP